MPSRAIYDERYGGYVEECQLLRREPEPFADWVEKAEPLSFRSFVPEPATIDGSWDRWHCENWGTKWDARFEGDGCGLGAEGADVALSTETNGVVATPEVLVYKFDTAWSPPVAAVEAMANAFPTLAFTLRYAEYGVGFAGEAHFAGGVLQSDVELDLDEAFVPEQRWF